MYSDGIDELIINIVEYIYDYDIDDEESLRCAHVSLLDSLGCALAALHNPYCMEILGPYFPGTKVPNGVRVPGTKHILDPIKAAFDITSCIRWLDFNDTILGKDSGHPSENIGPILAAADFVSRVKVANNEEPLSVKDLYVAIVKAYEIHGHLVAANTLSVHGIDQVFFVKLTSTAIVSYILGNDINKTLNALTHVWADGQSSRVYRHPPSVSQRTSWAAGDAAQRAVMFAMLAQKKEPLIPFALRNKKSGFEKVFLGGTRLRLSGKLSNEIVKRVLYKVSYPADMHGQTAIECALKLQHLIVDKLSSIDTIFVETTQACLHQMDKHGVLTTDYERTHCIQYILAVIIIHGTLSSDHYTTMYSEDPRVSSVRDKIILKENPEYTKEYYSPDKRAVANSIKIRFVDGSETEKIEINYPLGHFNRRDEAMPILFDKYGKSVKSLFDGDKKDALIEFWRLPINISSLLEADKFMDLWVHGD